MMEQGAQFKTVTAAEAHHALSVLSGEPEEVSDTMTAAGGLFASKRQRGHGLAQNRSKVAPKASALVDSMTMDPDGKPIKRYDRHETAASTAPKLNELMLEGQEPQRLDLSDRELAQRDKVQRTTSDGDVAEKSYKVAGSDESIKLGEQGLSLAENAQLEPFHVAVRRRNMEKKAEGDLQEGGESVVGPGTGQVIKYANHLDIVKDLVQGTYRISHREGGKPRTSRKAVSSQIVPKYDANGVPTGETVTRQTANLDEHTVSRGLVGGVSLKELSKHPLGRMAIAGLSPDSTPEDRLRFMLFKPAIKQHLMNIPLANQGNDTPRSSDIVRTRDGISMYEHIAEHGLTDPITIRRSADGTHQLDDPADRARVAAAAAHNPNQSVQFKYVQE